MSQTLGLRTCRRAELVMGTVVRLQVATTAADATVEEAFDRAFGVIRRVEQACSRFDPESELRRLTAVVGRPVRVSNLLFTAIQFACEVAEMTEGRFDPTVGAALERAGFDRHYLTGERVAPFPTCRLPVSYRNIVLNHDTREVLLEQPVLLDLGAVAKGLAIDLAVKELEPFEDFVVDAGGDIYVSGVNEEGEPWHIGIQHPTRPECVIDSLRLSDAAVCTSGGYERKSPLRAGLHHIMDPTTGASPDDVLSCTAIGPLATMADALSTAAFLLGAERGLALLEDAGLEGIVIRNDLTVSKTPGLIGHKHG